MIVANSSAREALHREILPHLGWGAPTPDVASRLGEPDERAAKLRQLADIYESVDDDRVPGAIIPLVRGSRMSFAVVADTAADMRRITPLVMAAVGLTLTDFDGRPSRLGDPVRDILSDHELELRLFRTPESDRERGARSVAALHRLVRTLQTMPVAPRELPRSTPQLLYEFDLALQAGNRDVALDRLREMEHRRAVDALNLRFLTVSWHAAFRQWRELRRERWFDDLCRSRRPPRITTALLRCRYETDLRGAALLADPPALRERFRTHVAPDDGNLFRELPPEADGSTAIMFALHASERRDEERIAVLRRTGTAGWEPAERVAFEELIDVRSESVTVPTEPEPTRLDVLRRLADGPSLTDAERAVVRSLAEDNAPLEVTTLAHSLTRDPTAEATRSEIAADGTPGALPDDWVTDNWEEWFEALSGLGGTRAREIVERLADELAVRTTLPTTADCELFATRLERALSDHEEKTRSALPHLARWLQRDDEWPTAERAPLYRHMITALLIVDARSVESLTVALSLLDGWLATGPPPGEYAVVLGDFRGELERLASDRTLDALIDLAELVVIHPVQDPGARAALWAELQARLGAFQARLSASQVAILNGICDVMGVGRSFVQEPRAPADDAPSETAAAWTGTIGLYSLRPALRRRVEETLKEVMPGASLEWRDDRVASAALSQLAARSDVMAIDWSAAKHAASHAIVDGLGEKEPLWVRGGASSIVSRILERIGGAG